MRTTETDSKEGDYEDLSIGGSTSSVDSSKLFKTLGSIEDWAFDDQDTTLDFDDKAKQEIMKMIERNEGLKGAESVESLENWTFDDNDSNDDSGYEDELEMKKKRKHLMDKTRDIKSSILHR